MKLFKCLVAGTALMLSAGAFAAEEPAPTEMACSDFKPTPAAAERFAALKGACEAIVEMNGQTFAKVTAVVRRVHGNTVTVNITKTNTTVTASPNPDLRVLVGKTKVRPRDLNKGQEISIYLSTDEFAQPNITQIAMVQEQGAPNAAPVEVPVEPEPALPTTASLLPAVATAGVLLMLIGVLVQRRKRSVA